MLSMHALRDQFAQLVQSNGTIRNRCGTQMRRAFCRLPFSVARKLIVSGFHPETVTRHWCDDIIQSLPEKTYLLSPKTVPFSALLLALERLSNPTLYARHIEFNKRRLLCCGDCTIVATCVQYMTLFDDDIRYITHAYTAEESMRILSRTNAASMYTMSHAFDEAVAEEILLRDPCMCEHLYEHQKFSEEFLHDMFFSHGITPYNSGFCDKITAQMAVDVLSGIRFARDASRFLYLLSKRVLDSNRLKNFVLLNIINGTNLNHYKWYAHTFLADRVSAMHVYARIFFDHINVDLAGYTMTRERLANICAFIDCYTDQLEHIVRVLLQDEHYGLLATIIDRVPVNVLTEPVILRAIRESSVPIRVSSLRVRSGCVIAQCQAQGYRDMVDFLDVVDVSTLVGYGVDPFTEYCFKTEWLNRDIDLLHLFVQRFGHCGPMLSKLLFEYPISTDAAMEVLDYMTDTVSMERLVPALERDFGYLMSTTRNFRLRAPRSNVTLKLVDVPTPGLESHLFESELSYEMSTTLQAYGISRLRTCAVLDLSLARKAEGVCLQFVRALRVWASVTERLSAQLYDICVLARHGLFLLYMDHLPTWTPVFDVLEGRPLTPPTCFDSDIIHPLDPTRLVRYEDLGSFVTVAQMLSVNASNYHAAINTLMGAVLTYMVVGSTMLESDDAVSGFLGSLTSAFLRGLKINGGLAGLLADARSELLRVRASSRARAGNILVPEADTIQYVLGLCTELCTMVVLDNN